MKERVRKFRIAAKDDDALIRSSKLTGIPVSVLIRLFVTSRHHAGIKPIILQRTIKERSSRADQLT